MKKIFLIVVVVLIVTNITNAQDVQVNGKSFQTVKKTVLNDKTEFYQLKEKGGKSAKLETYIKTGGNFYNTAFTETELKSFFNNGKMSSLGRMEKATFRDSLRINYIDKGIKIIFISKKGNQLNVFEYSGGVKGLVAALDEEDNRPEGELKDCEDGCLGPKYDECEAEFGVGNDVCFDDMIYCLLRCHKAFGRLSNRLLSYKLTVNTVKITR